MTLLRLVEGGLLAFLMLTPCLGFAAGDVALQLWNTHPRHANASHTDSSHVSWKTTPGILEGAGRPGAAFPLERRVCRYNFS